MFSISPSARPRSSSRRLPAPIARDSRTWTRAYFTIRLFSPAPNVIGVKFEHFRGRPQRGPAFEIASDPSTKPIIVNETDFVSLTQRGPRCPSRKARRLAHRRAARRQADHRQRAGRGGYAVNQQGGGTYVFERLDLGVGDLVYGLGERFTAVHPTARASRSGIETAARAPSRPTRTFPSSSPTAAGASWSTIRKESRSRSARNSCRRSVSPSKASPSNI